MFQAQEKTVHPEGWPTPIVVRELVSGDVFEMLKNGKPDQAEVRRTLVRLACFHQDGTPVFPTAEDVDKIPLRFMRGFNQLISAVMELNTLELDGEPSERPT